MSKYTFNSRFKTHLSHFNVILLAYFKFQHKSFDDNPDDI